ncbi:alpha/beta fold hydrolase [Roseobacter sinensis]|uniref:Alpha/beta hydrolase n=1 Tax=Roseobacter sinensis TaxID=2931391 RepID=A0ABT3BCQ6_9RHOB|nr:alpha/beta hydrolase [Roseobacter sp. WL0113]MCV3271351.1 alpha/beta hydrolase [Roseobacter sp. WL0113]
MARPDDFGASEGQPAGDQRGDPLVHRPSLWIHGAGLSGSTWQEMTQHLPLARTPDLPGHGAAPFCTPPRVEGFAGALLPDVPHGSVLIGHSLGGMVALELTARAPGRTAALILIEAIPTLRDRMLRLWSARVTARLLTSLPPRMIAWLSGFGQSDAAKTEVRAQLARHPRKSLSAALEAALAYDGRPHLAAIEVPTLVVTGRNNRATHRGAAMMAAQIPGAEDVMLPGGHMLHCDNPEGLRHAIDDFLHRRLG